MNVRVLDDKTLAASFDETHLEDRSCFELMIQPFILPRDVSILSRSSTSPRPHHHHSQTTTKSFINTSPICN